MSVYLTRQALRNDLARWKRKNRLSQLKRSIARLTEEKEAAQQKAENISYATRELIAAIARQMRPMHITGTLAPHYYCLTENTATRNSTTANTY